MGMNWGQTLIIDYDTLCCVITNRYIDYTNDLLMILITNQGLTPGPVQLPIKGIFQITRRMNQTGKTMRFYVKAMLV